MPWTECSSTGCSCRAPSHMPFPTRCRSNSGDEERRLAAETDGPTPTLDYSSILCRASLPVIPTRMPNAAADVLTATIFA